MYIWTGFGGVDKCDPSIEVTNGSTLMLGEYHCIDYSDDLLDGATFS